MCCTSTEGKKYISWSLSLLLGQSIVFLLYPYQFTLWAVLAGYIYHKPSVLVQEGAICGWDEIVSGMNLSIFPDIRMLK